MTVRQNQNNFKYLRFYKRKVSRGIKICKILTRFTNTLSSSVMSNLYNNIISMRQKIIYRRYFSLNVKKKSGSVAYIPDLSGG